MSRSVERVRAALAEAGIAARIVAMDESTRTAAEAAAAAGCALDAIVKSILFAGAGSGAVHLFLTPGGRQVDPARAAALAGEPLARADAAAVRAATGFAIGGVAPVGHPAPLPVWMDPRLMDFATVWAAAGTPRHIFAAAPADLLRAAGARLASFAT